MPSVSLDEGEFDMMTHFTLLVDIFVFSLQEDQVRKYADDHPFRVVESLTTSNYSKVWKDTICSLTSHDRVISQVGFEIQLSNKGNRVVSPEDVGTEVSKTIN